MGGWRQRLGNVPLAVQFLYLTFVFGLLSWLLDELTGEKTSWRGRLLGVLVYGVFMTAFTAWQRRRRGGRERQAELAEALHTGRLPVGHDRAEWSALLAREQRSNSRALPLAVGLFALGALASAAFALSGGATWWVLAALYAGLLLFVVVSGRRTISRIERLQRELDAGSPVE